MPKFSYKVLDARGQVKSGVLEAPDRAAAEQELARSGVKVQALDMLREPGQAPTTQVMKTMSPASGAMRPGVPLPPNNNPASGAMRPPVPVPPAKNYSSAERVVPGGESGGTQRPPVASGQASRPNQASGSMPRPPGLSLAPDPAPEAPSPGPSIPEPAATSESREPVSLARPMLGLGMVAVGLVALFVTAFTQPQAISAPSEPRMINLSGQLPELPGDATVVFDFPDGTDIERSVTQLNMSKDGRFEVALEVEAPPETFQVRARRPGQQDLVSPVCTMEGSQGKLTGELAVEKTKAN